MKKRLVSLIILTLILFSFSGCDMFGDDDIDVDEIWDIATEWTDDDGSQLSFVEQEDGSYYIDLAYNTTTGDDSTGVMGFIASEDYTITDNTLVGTYYTYFEPDAEYDITIEFSYSDDVLTAVIDVDESEGILVDKTLHLVEVDY
jgi:hypothetical protein